MSSGLDSATVAVLASKQLKEKGESLYAYTYVTYEEGLSDKNRNNVLDETEDVKKIVKMHPNIIPHFLNNEGKNCYGQIKSVLDIMEIPVKAFVNFPSL